MRECIEPGQAQVEDREPVFSQPVEHWMLLVRQVTLAPPAPLIIGARLEKPEYPVPGRLHSEVAGGQVLGDLGVLGGAGKHQVEQLARAAEVDILPL